ncbi:hypothetical protein ACWEWG_00435 [Streptomyces sp. NPDC003758]|uniref:hypothetical protein n=1 Tax=Streptomyces cynarae TaxID=2981134 RepID=UPI0036F3D0E7
MITELHRSVIKGAIGDPDDRPADDAPLRSEGGGCLGRRADRADPHVPDTLRKVRETAYVRAPTTQK